MLDAIVNKLKIFREKIYFSFKNRQDAAMELVDSLSSNTTAKSVKEKRLRRLLLILHGQKICVNFINQIAGKTKNGLGLGIGLVHDPDFCQLVRF